MIQNQIGLNKLFYFKDAKPKGMTSEGLPLMDNFFSSKIYEFLTKYVNAFFHHRSKTFKDFSLVLNVITGRKNFLMICMSLYLHGKSKFEE